MEWAWVCGRSIRVHGGHLYPLPQRLRYDSSLSAAAEWEEGRDTARGHHRLLGEQRRRGQEGVAKRGAAKRGGVKEVQGPSHRCLCCQGECSEVWVTAWGQQSPCSRSQVTPTVAGSHWFCKLSWKECGVHFCGPPKP